MADAKGKASKTVNRFARSTPAEAAAITSALGRRGEAGVGILRNVRQDAEVFGNPEELAAEAGNGVVQSSSPSPFRGSGANVEARKSAVRPKKAFEKIKAGLEDALELVRSADELPPPMRGGTTRSAAKHGGAGAVVAPEGQAPSTDKPFSLRLAGCGISLKDFAQLTGTPYRTVKEWSRGAAPVPGWVGAMVAGFEALPELRTVLEVRL